MLRGSCEEYVLMFCRLQRWQASALFEHQRSQGAFLGRPVKSRLMVDGKGQVHRLRQYEIRIGMLLVAVANMAETRERKPS